MQFTRSSGKRFYKRLFLVGVEGSRTECDYFSMFNPASNPKFEFWLLLHFEDGTQHVTSKACLAALCAHLPEYDKTLSRSDITEESISAAIQRAKTLLGAGDPTDWPREAGKTTVFTLCEAIRQVDAEEEVKMLTDLSGGASNERHCE